MATIAKYKFNPSLYADYLPVFNTQFTGYTKTDVNNGDGTITRTISHDTLKPTIMRFGNTSSITDREKSLLEVLECDTSNITNMIYMFYNCTSLTILNASSFNTSSVTTMSNMFFNCSSLISLDLSSFDTSNVIDMSHMFNACSSLTSLDLSNFNTSSVTDMVYMFQYCTSLTSLDLSNFDTSKVTNMGGMFANCTSLTSLDLSNWDTDKVTNMGNMFNKCPVSNIGLIYASSSTINSLLTQLGTDVARNIYYMDAPLNELTVQDNITYKKYELTMATFPYTLNKLPNGVADYIDVVNKVHVQRIGKVVLDGTSDENWTLFGRDNYSEWTTYQWRYTLPFASSGFAYSVDATKTMCDKLKYGVYVDGIVEDYEDYEHYRSNGQDANGISMYLYIWLNQSKASTTEELKTYLQSNPITVLYELATPIYTPLTEEDIAQLPLSAYKDGYINLSSDQLMPSFEFRMKASNRYQVDMLETGYYYLNAPVGNVKLGTANVDVQQMPCIVKVDNVGTGDSGYRLGFSNGGNTSILSFDKSNFTLGYYYAISGDLLASGRDCAYEEYIPISTGDSILINQLYQTTADPYSVALILYDSDKNMIERTTTAKDIAKKIVIDNVAYFRFSCIHDRTVTEPTTKVAEVYINPTTLAKLPSHHIPTSFTQGMKYGTDFGCWEGIIGARPIMFRTLNTDGAWKAVETSVIEDGNGIVLNRIEYYNTIVEDEFDIATGKLTKRVEGIVLDGSDDEDWKIWNGDNANTYMFYYQLDANGSLQYSTPIICDKFKGGGTWNDTNHVWINEYKNMLLHIQKDHLGNNTVDALKQWLQQNPIVIYYALAVPKISYKNMSSTQVKTVAKTALQCARWDGYLNPQVKPSHLTYPVPSLVGNRTYTVVHNRKNITGSTKPIELNLGGTVVQLNDASSKTLVKTPSTLAHSNLIFIGGESTVDHVMVLDGDWTNKPIEYFENMMGHDTDAIITIIGNGQIDDVEEQYLW